MLYNNNFRMGGNSDKEPFSNFTDRKRAGARRSFFRKIILPAMAALMAIFFAALSGCDAAEPLSDYEEAAADFCVALANKDFSSAHKFFWQYAGYKNEKDFIADCNYVIDTLKVTDITFKNVRVESDGGENLTLKYTSVLDTETAGQISSECFAHIVSDNGSPKIVYTRSLLLSDFEDGDMIVISSVAGKRGEIISADGEAVAENNYADTVYVVPSQIEDFSSTLAKIREIADVSDDAAKKAQKNFEVAQKNNYGTSVVASFAHDSIDDDTEARLKTIKGVYVDRTSLTPQRLYPFGYSFSHIVGYANTPNSEEQLKVIEDGGYSPSSIYGKAGLENSYNDRLLGKDGCRVAVTNENYASKRVLFERPAENGEDIFLTVDSGLQEFTYYTLYENLTAEQTAVAIVIDYSDCSVKSMAAFPSYDSNIFSFPVSSEDYERLFTADGTDQPLFPRATFGLYPPGSIIKPFIGGAALDAGVITENTAFPYEIRGNVWYPNGWIGKGITRSYDSGSPLVLKNALVKSDNIYFSWVGMKMGKDLLFSAFDKIGFEKDYDFDIPVATANMINDDTNVMEYMLADMAIGHGEVLVTPIQMAALYTTFTNNGNALKPYLVDKICGTDENGEYAETFSAQPSTLIENVMSASAVSKIREGLRGVVTDGTARSIGSQGRKIFAKTGTAIKQENREQRISWICAWVEEEEEKRLVLVMVDGPREQDTIKFKIAKTLLQTDGDAQ